MQCWYLLLVATALATGWSQSPPQDCLSLRTRLEVFYAKYSLYRFGGPAATLETVEAELGKPTLHLESIACISGAPPRGFSEP